MPTTTHHITKALKLLNQKKRNVDEERVGGIEEKEVTGAGRREDIAIQMREKTGRAMTLIAVVERRRNDLLGYDISIYIHSLCMT